MLDIIEYCNNNQGFIMAVLTGVYVLATIGIVWLGSRANAISQKNVATLAEIENERLRPLVEVALLDDETPSVGIKVANIGQTPAYDVKIVTTPQLSIVLGENKTQPLGIIEHGIGSLGSGASVSSFVAFFDAFRKAYPGLRFKGLVSYRASTGKTYETPVDLDARYMEHSARTHRKTIHDVAEQLVRIHRELNLLASGHHMPHVITEDIEHKRSADEARYAKYRSEKKDKDSGQEGARV